MASWLYNTLLGGDNPTPGAIRLPDSASPSPAPPPPPYTLTKSPPRPRAPLSLPALNALRGKRFILASASPRRKQLLSLIGLTDIEVIPSKFAENLDKTQYTPFEYVLATATNKCADVYRAEIDNAALGEPAMVLAADTVIVTYEGEIIEKPRSEEAHLAMLKTLRDGMPHKVYTAVVAMVPLETVVHPGYAQESHVEETTVEFDRMVTDELLEAYVKTREGADKAGGYAIQGTGSILVKRIEGTFDNVVGLPLRGTLRVIEKAMSAEEMQEEGEGEEEE